MARSKRKTPPAPEPKAPQGLLASTFAAARRTANRAHELAGQAEALADRLMGTEPHRVASEPLPTSDRPTTLESLVETLANDRVSLSRIHDALKRISQL